MGIYVIVIALRPLETPRFDVLSFENGCDSVQIWLLVKIITLSAGQVQLMMRMDFPTMHLFQMSHAERNRLLEVVLFYYRLHLPDFPELKSLSVLQALYE